MKKRSIEYFWRKKLERFSKKIAPTLHAIDDSGKILRNADPEGKLIKHMFTTNRIPKEPAQ